MKQSLEEKITLSEFKSWLYKEWEVDKAGSFLILETRIESLVKEVENETKENLLNSFEPMVQFIQLWLDTNYPADVFVGKDDADKGTIFVSSLRKLIANLTNQKDKQE